MRSAPALWIGLSISTAPQFVWNGTRVVAWFALAPIGLALLLLVGLRWPATRAMPVCALLTCAVSAFVWKVSTKVIGAALVESAFITTSILLILFGALGGLMAWAHVRYAAV